MRVFARPDLTVPRVSFLPTTCIQFPLVSSSFSYAFSPLSVRSTSRSAWKGSGTIPMRLAALTLKVTQLAPQRRLDSPTRPAQHDVEQVPRLSTGGHLRSCFPRGFFPGWLSSASFPLVLETMRTTSSQVSLPCPFIVDSSANLSSSPLTISRLEPGISCFGLLLPRPHCPERSISLSRGTTYQTQKQEFRS
jgi:hypothetical protein